MLARAWGNDMEEDREGKTPLVVVGVDEAEFCWEFEELEPGLTVWAGGDED